MIYGIRLLPENTNVPFIRWRYITYGLSAIMILATLFCFLTKGLNLGVDFKGGILVEMKSQNPIDLADMRQSLNELDLGDVALQEFGSNTDVLIRVEHQDGGEKGQLAAIEKIKKCLGPTFESRRIETVGPKIGDELVSNGWQAILWCLLAMLVYVWLRFEWQFGLCAIIALIHDTIGVFGLYAIFGIEFNLTAIVAILTTLGYSINDTVVIYDRIRENLRKSTKTPIPDVLNMSINETLSRTILTSGSTLMALFALYFFGGEVIANYSLPIIAGVLIGTYSSICLSAPLLLGFNLTYFIEPDVDTVP